MAKKPPGKSSNEIENIPIDPDILEKLEGISTPEILARIETHSTKGPYPPPAMMADYKERCPEVYDQIVKGVEVQRDHRVRQEEKQIDHTISIQRNSESGQTYISYLAIIGAVAIIVMQLYLLNRVEHWATSAILAALAVGGKPVATIIAELISKYSNKQNSPKSDE